MSAGCCRQALFDELHFKRFSIQWWDYALHKPLNPSFSRGLSWLTSAVHVWLLLCSSILIDFVNEMIAERNWFLWWSVHVLMTRYVHRVKCSKVKATCSMSRNTSLRLSRGRRATRQTSQAKKQTKNKWSHATIPCRFLQSSAERCKGTHIQMQSHVFTLWHETHICQREVLLPSESKGMGNVVCWMGGQAHTWGSANISHSIDCWGISLNESIISRHVQPTSTSSSDQTRLSNKHQQYLTFTQVQWGRWTSHVGRCSYCSLPSQVRKIHFYNVLKVLYFQALILYLIK